MTEKQKNEHSVLISLDSMAEDEGEAAGQVNTAGAESGLIDIGALENAGLLDDAGESVDLPIEATAPSSASQVKEKQGGRLATTAAMATLASLIVAGSVYFTIRYLVPEPAEETPIVPVHVEPRAAKPSTAEAKAGAEAKATPAAAKSAATAADAGAAVAAKAGKPGGTKSKRKRRWKPRKKGAASATPAAAPSAAPAAAAEPAKPAAKAEPAKPKEDEVDDLLRAVNTGKAVGKGSSDLGDTPLLPARLTRNQIISVVRRNAAAMRSCRSGGDRATVKVKVVIAGSGSVSKASVLSGAPNAQISGCVEGKVKAFRFPKFRQKTMSVTLPFAI